MSVDPNEMGFGLEGTPSIPLRQMGAMARTNADLHPQDTIRHRDWMKLANRYEHQAQEADANAREIHGWEGDDS